MSVKTGNKLSKNLPRRASSDHRSHQRRARSIERGQKRKAERIRLQGEREKLNREIRAKGMLAPVDEYWGAIKERRALKRDEVAAERASSTWRKLVGPVNKCVRGHSVSQYHVPGKGCMACKREGYVISGNK